jgi:hypothetical protein
MGEVKRYRLTAMEFITGKGWVKLPNQGQYHINEQPHKKGGWCKWSDVIKLEKENKRLRENWENLEKWVKGKKINFTGDDRFWRGYDDFHGDVRAKMEKLEKGGGQG